MDGGDGDDRSHECIDQLRQSFCLPSLSSIPTGLNWWEVSFIQLSIGEIFLRHFLYTNFSVYVFLCNLICLANTKISADLAVDISIVLKFDSNPQRLKDHCFFSQVSLMWASLCFYISLHFNNDLLKKKLQPFIHSWCINCKIALLDWIIW